MLFLKSIILIFVLLILNSCKKPFESPSIDSGISNLIVECMITTDPPPYTIKLTKSVLYNKPFIPENVSNALITITDDLGNIESVKEDIKNTGNYKTSGKMTGQLGRSYKISISVNKKNYESSWEKINDPPIIDSLYIKSANKQTLELYDDGTFLIYNVPGLDFFLSVNPFFKEDYYYKFKSIAIQESHCLYRPNLNPAIPRPPKSYDSLFSDTLYTWQSYITTSLIANNAQNINKIKDYKIGFYPHFEQDSVPKPPPNFSSAPIIYTKFTQKKDVIFKGDTLWDFPGAYNTDHYKIRNYDGVIVIAEVYSVSKTIFNIFTEESKQIVPDNIIFDPIPTQISSNIVCLTNPSEKPLGYFAAGSIKRIKRYIYWIPGYDKPNIYMNADNLSEIIQYNSIRELYKPDFWIPHY